MRKIILVGIVSTLILILGTTKAKADDEVGAWAAVDENGQVVNVDVCTESVCGVTGKFGGSVPYCSTCKYVKQLPAESSGNVVGFKDSTYDSSSQTFTTNYGGTIKDGTYSPPPWCDEAPQGTEKCFKRIISCESYKSVNNVQPEDSCITNKQEVLTIKAYKFSVKVKKQNYSSLKYGKKKKHKKRR